MIRRGLILSLILLFLAFTAGAQTIYQFTYRFGGNRDTTLYHAFFVRFTDGSGLIRI